MRLILKNIFKYSKYVCSSRQMFVRNFTRNIVNHHTVILSENTLTGRILHYLNSHREKSPDSPNLAKKLLETLEKGIVTNLHLYGNDDIINAHILLEGQEYTGNKNVLRILKELDLECCIRLNELTPKDIFKILSVYLKIIPHRIVGCKFYGSSLNRLCESVNQLSKDDLIQLIFYIGLKKKTKESQMGIRKCLRYLNQSYLNNLTKEDLCIVCSSSFKTSTKISNKFFLEKVRNYLNDNLYLFKDPALFTTLIKTIRHNRYQDDNLLSTISCTVFFNNTLQFYSFPIMCHILALYADHLYYDENLLATFTTKCLEELKDFDYSLLNNDLPSNPRVKDIKRLLWSLSNLNYNGLSKSDIKDVIVPQIISRIYLREDGLDSESLIEIILYLWMLNYRAYELVPYALKPKYVRAVKDSKSLGVKRLNLLLSCIYFEDRDYFKTLNIRAEKIPHNDPNVQLRRRPLLKKVFDNLKYASAKTGLNRFEIGYQVPYLNVIGITGYKNNIYKAVHIEVLDDFTCVKNKECYPSGLMQLKLRILDGMEEALITIPETDLADMTEAEILEYLLDELDLVC